MKCPNGHEMEWEPKKTRGKGIWVCYRCQRKPLQFGSPSDTMIRGEELNTKKYGRAKDPHGGKNGNG